MQETSETRVPSLGREDPLEEGMAAHSRIPAWRIPWTEVTGGLQSMGREELDTTEVTKNATHMSFVHVRVLGHRPGLHAVDSTNKQQLGVWGPLALVPQPPCQGWLLRDPLSLSLILIASWSRDPSIPTF